MAKIQHYLIYDLLPIAEMLSISLLCQMNRFKALIGIALLVVLMSSCASLKVNQAATTNDDLATMAINQIKDSGIVVIFPTEHKKEKALIKFAKTNSTVQEDIDQLKTRREERLEIWQSAKNEYSFNKISIVPDSLLKSYIADPKDAQEIDETGDLTKANLGDIYVLYTEYGGFEVKRNGHFIPNPFPNKVQAAWGSSIKDFIGVQSEEKSIKRFFTELEVQLNKFYILTKIEGN